MRGRARRRLLSCVCFYLCCIFLFGCSTGNRPGSSTVTSPLGTALLKQSDNPLQSSSQDITTSNETSLVLPAGSIVATSSGTNVTQIQVSQPTPIVQRQVQTHAAVIGAAQTDTSKALAAKYKALLPVMIVGLLLILGGAALAYFGWWTKAAILWAIGVAMITFAAVLPGHEVLIIGAGLITAVIACLLVLYVYHKGTLDQYVQSAKADLAKIVAAKNPSIVVGTVTPAGPLD